MAKNREMTGARFEERAKKIRKYLRSDIRFNEKILKRPFIFEFTGTPSAGKTTTINELDKLFRRVGFRVFRPQEGAEVIRHVERSTPLYNIRTALYAISNLIDCAHSHSYDIVLFDRCAFDPYCWMMHWRQKGKLSEKQERMYQEFFLSPFWIRCVDRAYFMLCDPEVAIQREQRIALSRKLGETTNPETIRNLCERYRLAYAKLRRTHPQLKLFDATHLNERAMVEEISQDIFAVMEKKSAE